MLMPSLFRDNILDDFWGRPYRVRGFDSSANEMMKTDVKETDQGYEMTMNLPGVKKENVKAELKEGYLLISATSNSENDEQDNEGRYIRRERYYGSCSRSFFVGEEVKQEDIKARFEDGTLKLSIPKKEAQPAIEENHYITIEG